MRDFLNNNKMLIGGVLALGVLAWAYFAVFTGESGELLSETKGVSPVSQELLVTLSNLRTIRLDEAIFKDPVFVSLSDFGVTIPLQTIGRRNPFAPVGSSSPGGGIEAPPGVR